MEMYYSSMGTTNLCMIEAYYTPYLDQSVASRKSYLLGNTILTSFGSSSVGSAFGYQISQATGTTFSGGLVLEELFIAQGKSKLSIDLMIGNNDLIKGNVESYLVNKVTPLLSSSIAGLHLDVEPHTFPDWDTNKEYYLNEYVNMVKIAKIYCIQNKLTLSISIPVHYPNESIEQLFELLDIALSNS
jgi:hypothetical protein